MDVKHQTGGSMEITLTQADIDLMKTRHVCTADESQAEPGDVFPFVNQASGESETAWTQFYSGEHYHYMGVYLPGSLLSDASVSRAVESGEPIAVISNETIASGRDAMDQMARVFGDTGEIVVRAAMQAPSE